VHVEVYSYTSINCEKEATLQNRMSFKTWFEAEEKDFDFFKNLVLGRLNLSRADGLSATLNTWEPDALINILNDLGEFKNLPNQIQTQVIGRVRSGEGTLADLIKMMSSGSV
jgi:hypothetical protein